MLGTLKIRLALQEPARLRVISPHVWNRVLFAGAYCVRVSVESGSHPLASAIEEMSTTDFSVTSLSHINLMRPSW